MTITYTEPKLDKRNGMKRISCLFKGKKWSGSLEIISNAYSKESAFIRTKPDRIPQEDWDNLVKKALLLI